MVEKAIDKSYKQTYVFLSVRWILSWNFIITATISFSPAFWAIHFISCW